MQKIDGIKDLTGRDPIGAAVRCGEKGSQGYPINTDMFYIVQPREENGRRNPHPLFKQFNEAPKDHRKVIRGNLVHQRINACFEHYLKAQAPKGSSHPNKVPFCTGDGEKAIRWMKKDADDFQEIKCSHSLCEYRLTKPPMCKPFARLLFRLRWKEGSSLPTPLVKFTTGSWNTVANLKGFFDYVLGVANDAGIKDPKLFGLPFILTLAMQNKPSEQTRFPVVTITPEIKDPVDFFREQGERLQQIAEMQNNISALPETVETLEDSTLIETYEDTRIINV